MRVLVTGCGGFLGREIVRQLIARGDEVVGISRQTYPDLLRLGMQHHQGDLRDRSFCLAKIRNIDAVVHTAAVAGVWGPWQHFYSINTLATEHVIDACRSAEIRSLVFTSSPSVTFDGKDQRGVDEQVEYPKTWLCHYPHSKALAEQAILNSHVPGQLHTAALRPHLIWGNDDPHLLPRIIDRAKRGRLRIVGEGTNVVDTVHVINAAAAHLDAIDALQSAPQTAGGRAYFIAQDEPVSCWDWISQLCELAGVPCPDRRIRYASAYRIGACLEGLYRITGRTSEPPMTRFVAAQLAKDHYFDITAAKQRLGYRVRLSMDEGLKSLAKRFGEHSAG
ncbi:NAD-dependent epimerase/dehydratase family protein [Novipirellula artificiosorum]|uniref:3 beta-hydroxysteroid dehydrogenase/Delta 5-->4-isomerase n=1 Tax=Novipirellula artificiosorum TaxID=2528016 RepID=A0A5C6DMM7_9BACT|nr:NAD-dependent epimerase/dehydratase family protein [Novipirellula artificiosorum]TWU36186.1 3 beta-hydroxysteroid dehydrogenase/Delta 5-->4-isomerase [Novipirellula artificiosorum]